MRLPLPKLNNLYGRIFAIFWFTMLLVLFAVLTLPGVLGIFPSKKDIILCRPHQ
nr:hypothetical protein [Vibrio cholerae]